MTHIEVEQRDIVDAYVRGRLTGDESRAFEEHYFACDQCFEQVRTTEMFASGIVDAVNSGALQAVAPKEGIRNWWRPAFAFAMAACIVLAVSTGWLAMVELPRVRTEITRQRQQLELEHLRTTGLEKQVASSRLPGTEANLPFALLEASRAAAANEVRVPEGSTQIVLWMEVPAERQISSFRAEVRNESGTTVDRIEPLLRNAQGALTASVPADRMPAGKYSVVVH